MIARPRHISESAASSASPCWARSSAACWTPRWRGRHSQLIGWLLQQVGESHRCSATDKSQTRAATNEKQRHDATLLLRSRSRAVHSPVRTWRSDERATCLDRMRQRGGIGAQRSRLSRVRRCGRCVRGAVAALPHGGSTSHEQVLWRQSGWATKIVLGAIGEKRHHTTVRSAQRREALRREGGCSAVGLPG